MRRAVIAKTNLDHHQLFLDAISSPQTKIKYGFDLKSYLKYLKVTDANKLITPDLIDSPIKTRQVEDQIIQYIKHMINLKKLSSSTINNRLAAVLLFYTIARVNVNRKYISKFKPPKRKVRKGDLSYTHEQILTLINTASVRDKVVILLMVSTGMRIGSLCDLTVGSLHPITLREYGNDDKHIYKIVVYEGEEEQYYTFTTFEAAEAIDLYLQRRKSFGEDITADSPLIRDEYNRSIQERASKPEFITTRGMQRLFDRILEKNRLRVRHPDRELHKIMKTHGLRKFTITHMKKAQLDYSDREFLVGHKVSRGLDVNYDRATEEDRLQQYLKAMDLLTISPENRLRKQVAEQDYTIQTKMKEKDEQIQELTRQMVELRQMHDDMKALLSSPKLREMITNDE